MPNFNLSNKVPGYWLEGETDSKQAEKQADISTLKILTIPTAGWKVMAKKFKFRPKKLVHNF